MRQNDGWKFDFCVGLEDLDAFTGKVFKADVLDCHDKPLDVGDVILVSGRPYRYKGDDNLGRSHFAALAPFPKSQY